MFNLFSKNKVKPDKPIIDGKPHKIPRHLKHLEHHYFKGHICHVPTEEQTKLVKCAKFLQRFTCARYGDIRAQRMYRSYAEFTANKHDQYHNYPCSIHPYSKIRLLLEIITIFAIQVAYISNCIHYSYPDDREVFVSNPATRACEGFFILYIISNFFTGYLAGNTSRYVILDLRKIILRYVRTRFIIDMAFVPKLLMTIIMPMTAKETSRYTNFGIASAKIFQIPMLFIHLHNILEVTNASEVTKTMVELFLLVLNYLFWNIFFQFYADHPLETSDDPAKRSCSWLVIADLTNDTAIDRFSFALTRAVDMLRRNSNLDTHEDGKCSETFFVVSWIIAKIILTHCALKYMLVLYGLESARARYYMMIQQVYMYMNQRKFPTRMKTKILKFYAVRYQAHFIDEQRVVSCMSGQLREDAIMHSARHFVRKVDFLQQLPRPLLLQIGIKLKVVIFIAGDIIFKINTVGDCIYFIDKGTVAIYSEAGREVRHLEDGDFFGEIALVMTRFQTASAVAVTNCELFRLDRRDFNSTIARYPTVYEEIKKLAANRYEITQALDDYYKTELRMRKSQVSE